MTLVDCQTRFEADVIAAKLRANDIAATAQHTDSPYSRDAIGLAIDYHHVLVFKSDVDKARAVLAKDES